MFEIAGRVIWFEDPEQALNDPVRFMAYAMRYPAYHDMQVIRSYVSDDEFREVLQNAPPGIIDARSWAFWHVKMGQFPVPEMPQRTFRAT
ncbi:MAG: hypothetical protein R3C59_03835 [Planctomycetaceae bacterium]